jgi:hypothetical protein
MRGAFLSTAPALARFPFNCALLERIDHRAPGHVYGGSFAVRVSLCEARVELPRVAIPHHPSAKTNTTTEPSANNLRTIGSRCPLWWFAWKKLVSRCVEFTPRMGTRGDESTMNSA